MIAKVYRYGFSGGLATASHYVLFVLLLNQIGPVPASALGGLVGFLVAFGLNYRFTFPATANRSLDFWRFLAVAVLLNVINLVMLKKLIDSVLFHPYLAQLLCSFLIAALGFVINNIWSYREHYA